MVAISPINRKKTCSICGKQVRGKRFVYYEEMPKGFKGMREYVPICKECDSLTSITVEGVTLSLLEGLFLRIDPLRFLKAEQRKKRQKRKK
jgi:hypothetical protein